MKVYLAAASHRREEIKKVAKELRLLGIDVQARWLEELQVGQSNLSEKFSREMALMDVHDVREADILIRFTDDLDFPYVRARLATGARMFEMGYAYAQGKPIIVVGGRQPIFDYLPNIVHVKDVDELKNYLGASGND